jgi:hypothetical protein
MATLKLISVSGYSTIKSVTTSTGSGTGSGTSGSTGSTTETTSTTIFGGTAGSCSSGMDSENVCDSCSTAVTPCNNRRVYPDLKLYFQVQTDNSAMVTGTSRIVIKSDSTTISLLSSDLVTAINSSATAVITWGSLCSQLASSANCDTSFYKTLVIGIDKDSDGNVESGETVQVQLGLATADAATKLYHSDCSSLDGTNNEGFCHFTIVPGDSKVYVKNPRAPSTYPLTGDSGINYEYVRFYYASESTFSSLNPASEYKDLAVSMVGNEPFLNNNKIDGLDNGHQYFFMMANVDSAGNVNYFSPVTYLNANIHSAIPDEVVGVLDDKRCFIATAAYGSPLDEKVKTLRLFRDKFLLTNSLGKSFVEFYYKVSPQLADLIKQSDISKAAVRGVLFPIVFIVEKILNGTFWLFAILLLVIGIAVGVILNKKKIQRGAV